ncbi:MAG: hypothetical protein ACR2NY_05035 [Alphaproteobacteria bacterium]
MKGLQILVIVLAVMILFATTALVVLVIKKPRGGRTTISEQILRGNYITSYGVGDNIAVVVDNDGEKIIHLYDGHNFRFLSKLVIQP